MCGVERVAISFGKGRISFVFTGITFDAGASVAGAGGTASGDIPDGEQAHRIRARKRSVRKILCMEDGRNPIYEGSAFNTSIAADAIRADARINASSSKSNLGW